MLLINTWPTWTTKTTAYKKNLKVSLRQTSKLEKVLTERIMLKALETELTMSFAGANMKFNPNTRRQAPAKYNCHKKKPEEVIHHLGKTIKLMTIEELLTNKIEKPSKLQTHKYISLLATNKRTTLNSLVHLTTKMEAISRQDKWETIMQDLHLELTPHH